jgi:sialic acid synthase SpsE
VPEHDPAVAQTGKPLIISTGMGSVTETAAAVQTARAAGAQQLILLACTASYPAPAEETNLRRLPVLAEAFDVQVGFSDHSPGLGACIGSIACGATLIEKHVALTRTGDGVDTAFSLTPQELTTLVAESARAWRSLGTRRIGPTDSEREGLRFRRSLYVVTDVRAGDTVTPGNVRSIRPAGGLLPVEIDRVLGRRFTRDVGKGTPLDWSVL